MASDTTHADEPVTGSVALAPAGEQLIAVLTQDDPPHRPADDNLYRLGCIVSALALHVPADWFSVALLSPPAQVGAQIEIRCSTVEAARAVVESLPWPDGTTTTTAVGDKSTHYVTRGVLWGYRVAVVGLEPLGGAR